MTGLSDEDLEVVLDARALLDDLALDEIDGQARTNIWTAQERLENTILNNL